MRDGDLVFDEEKEKALANTRAVEEYRKQRESECFSVINRGQLWYERLTEKQQEELRQWYKAWLDAEMFAFFKAQGLNDYGTAGLMGNLYAESSMKADNFQNSGNSKLGLSDAEYTEQVDNGVYTNFIHDGYGYGLAQWTYYSRKQALLAFMTENGVSIGDKRKQCEFIMKELQGYKNLLTTLKTATSVKEASDAVLTDYERPADQSEAVKVKRASFGQGYYDNYAAKPAPTPVTDGYYRVQVGAFKVKANAEALLQKLKDAGFDGFIRFGA